MTRLAAILFCFALTGCSAARPEEAKSVNLGVKVTLAPGASVSSKSGEVKVRFVAVTEDSRCPRDVTCVWAGEVKVQLEIQVAKVASQAEMLEGGSTVAGAYRVTLVKVEPQPVSTVKIAPQDYRATLAIDAQGE
jgi:hypothetical protein